MKRALLTILSVLLFTTVVSAQKKSTLFGDAWVGVVEYATEATREVKLVNPEKKTESFVGFVVAPYVVKLKDGTSREFEFSAIKPGMRLRAFYKSKTEDQAGQKRNFNLITKLQLLGHDDYTQLRDLLKLDPSTPVSVVQSLNPSKSPLKLHLALEPQNLDIAVIKWVHQWNAEQSAEYGRIEIVDDFTQSDASLVVIWGQDDSYFNPERSVDYGNGPQKVAFATVYLVSKDGNGLHVAWEDRTVVETNTAQMTFVGFGKGLEKRLKARSK
jgi:hypothetical protein